VNPAAFQKLDKVIHEKTRLAIVSLLAASPELSFTELRDSLNLTDGNLCIQLRTLQQAGYIAVTKTFENKRPRSTCSLTAKGRQAFAGYIGILEEIVKQNRPS
jgi:DNA-binding HxlR family transcriptional regulator